MPITTSPLAITITRRILGTGIVIGMLVAAVVAAIRPHMFDYLKAVNNPLLPGNAAAISLFMFCCSLVGSQLILFPCLFSRFPRWMYQRFTPSQLEEMAKVFLGARLTDSSTRK